jgi:hypothetical protein
METSQGAYPEADLAVLRARSSGCLWPGSFLQIRLWEVDGQVAGRFETKARLSPGYHTVRFGLIQDVTTGWRVLASGGFGGRHDYYVGEASFVAAPGGRYVLRGTYDASRSIKAKAWVEDGTTGREAAEADLEQTSGAKYHQAWNP